jgi:hypothetical protein
MSTAEKTHQHGHGEKAAVESLAVSMGSPILQQTRFTGSVISASSISVRYFGLPGNQPNKNGNALALWQDSQIPWGTAPIQKITISLNTPTGSQTFDDLALQSKSYVVGYSTGSDLSTICSTVLFTPGNPDGTPFSTSIAVQSMDSDSLVLRFDTPVGNDAKGNQNWIGLWEGQTFTWDGKNRLTKVNVNKTTANSTMVVPYSFKIDTYYTIVYASGPADTCISTALTFQTAPFLK